MRSQQAIQVECEVMSSSVLKGVVGIVLQSFFCGKKTQLVPATKGTERHTSVAWVYDSRVTIG